MEPRFNLNSAGAEPTRPVRFLQLTHTHTRAHTHLSLPSAQRGCRFPLTRCGGNASPTGGAEGGGGDGGGGLKDRREAGDEETKRTAGSAEAQGDGV